MCYNLSTYPEPPLGVGRFGLPRHKAARFQGEPVCRFQHTPASENWAGCSCQVATPLQSPYLEILTVASDFVKDKKIRIGLFFTINLGGGHYAYMP